MRQEGYKTIWSAAALKIENLCFGRWVECHQQNAIVASTYKHGRALHVWVIPLLYGQTTNGSLHEHCNH